MKLYCDYCGELMTTEVRGGKNYVQCKKCQAKLDRLYGEVNKAEEDGGAEKWPCYRCGKPHVFSAKDCYCDECMAIMYGRRSGGYTCDVCPYYKAVDGNHTCVHPRSGDSAKVSARQGGKTE